MPNRLRIAAMHCTTGIPVGFTLIVQVMRYQVSRDMLQKISIYYRCRGWAVGEGGRPGEGRGGIEEETSQLLAVVWWMRREGQQNLGIWPLFRLCYRTFFSRDLDLVTPWLLSGTLSTSYSADWGVHSPAVIFEIHPLPSCQAQRWRPLLLWAFLLQSQVIRLLPWWHLKPQKAAQHLTSFEEALKAMAKFFSFCTGNPGTLTVCLNFLWTSLELGTE